MKISKKYGPGAIFIAVSLVFGIGAITNHSFGQFSKPGPALFPVLLSVLLFLIGVVSIATTIKTDPFPAYLDLHALAMVVAGLVAFALCASFINMAVGIAALVFVTSFAVKEKIPKFQNVKVIAVLIAAAVFFKYVLGLNIPLWK
jgi:hypothetical protein